MSLSYDCFMGGMGLQPWERGGGGPALVVFTDGKVVGATLDRNGLRPARSFNNFRASKSADQRILRGSQTDIGASKLQNVWSG